MRNRETGALLLIALALSGALPAQAAKLDEPAIKSDYRRVLAVVASGDQDAALDELVRFESAVLGDTPKAAVVEEFWRFKLQAVGSLVRVGSLDLIVPIIVLHHDAYSRYLLARKSILASHSRTMAIELGELYAAREESVQARKIAAMVLISLAGLHQQASNLHGANRLFAQALELDPQSAAALLGLAANYEKNGQYRDAVGHLERSVRIDPANHEARLRLGLCLKRIDEYGKDEEGRERLLELLKRAEELPPWIHVLTYQELANLNIAAKRPRQAEQRLREGLEIFPDDQGLTVQLAMLLNRTHRRTEAQQLLAGLAAQPDYDSPRRRYNSPPTDLIDKLRVELRAAVQPRLRLLAQSLDMVSGAAASGGVPAR